MLRPFRQNPKRNKGISMPDAFVVTAAAAPAPLNIVGEQITVLAPGSQTGVTRSSARQVFFTDDRAISPEASDILKLADILNQQGISMVLPIAHASP
jgi:hypothetical protein